MRPLLAIALASVLAAPPLRAQVEADAARGPQFLLATNAKTTVRLDVSRVPVLHQRLALDLQGVSLKEAITQISERARIVIWYSDDVLPRNAAVDLRADNITVAAALTDVLLNTGLDVVFSRDGTASLVRRKPTVPIQLTGTVAGRVTDARTGNPVPQAQVSIMGTTLARSTNDEGGFTITGVPAGVRDVSVRRLGYDPQTREVSVPEGGSVTADFALVGVASRLHEIVTTVTGGQRREEIGNVIASVNADSLMQVAPVMSFGDLIQARAPGVLSMTTGNNVGQAGTIRIRGLNSFGVSNDPVLVVDGVRIEATRGGSGGLVTTPNPGGWSGRLADLAPTEIASVEIVKGPSAATLYGTDAANGVLVITTKRGQSGRPRWTAYTEQGVLSQRLEDWREAYFAFGRNLTTGAVQRCTLVQRAAGTCVLDSLVTFNTLADPDTRPYEDGRREQYGIQVSGGSARGTTFFVSGDYQQEIGTAHMPRSDQAFLRARRGVAELPSWQLRPNAFEKANVRGNVSAPLGSEGAITVTSAFISNEQRQPLNRPFNQVGYRDANDGWLAGSSNERPAYRYSARNEDVVRRFIGGISSNYRVTDWFIARVTVGADLSTNAFGTLVRRGEAAPQDLFSSLGRRTANDMSIARYSVDFGATATHDITRAISGKTSGGLQFNRRSQRASTIIASNLPLGGETIAGAANPLTAVETTVGTAVAGGYVEEVFGIQDRLFVTGALRFDGASAFGEDFSTAVYPKASMSWIVANQDGGRRLPGVSTLRLRVAFGASGVQPNATAALQQIQLVSGVGVTAAVPGAILGAFGNPDLKPERTNELEGGVDAELLTGRVRLELTGYHRTSHDALINRALAPEVGGGFRWENLGSVRNRGLELQVNADVLSNSRASAGLTVTGSVNDNKLLRLGEGVVVSAPTASVRQEVGYPVQGRWGRRIASFADANNNGIIEPSEVTLTEPRYIGPGFPTREAAVSPYLRLLADRLRFSGVIHYRGGFYVSSNTTARNGNGCVDFQGAWCRAVNDISTPLADQAQAQARVLGVSVVEPGTYVVLRELSATAAVPPKWVRRLAASDARLTLAARNLAILSQAGTYTAYESDIFSRDEILNFSAGPPTYLLLRFHLNY